MQWVSLAPPHPFQAKIWAGLCLLEERSSLLRVSGRAFPTFRAHLSPLSPAVSPLPLLSLQLGREQSRGGSPRVGVLSSVMWGAWLCPSLGQSDVMSGHLPLGTICVRCSGQERRETSLQRGCHATRAESSPGDEERWGLMKPPVSLKPRRQQGPRPWKLRGVGGLPLTQLSFGSWASTWGLPASCRLPALPACPAVNTSFPSARLRDFLAFVFCKPLKPLEHFLPVLFWWVAGGQPQQQLGAGGGWDEPSPGEQPTRRRGRGGWARCELLAPGVASSPVAAPSDAGRAGLDAASVFFPC